jgi:MFS family permease
MRKINFYKWVCDWGVAEKDYRRHAHSLGFLYFAELFAYQAFSLLSKGESFIFLSGNDWVTLALHGGMLLGAIGWCWWVLFKKGLTYGRALKRSVGFYTLALAWIVAMSVTIALGQWRVGDYFTAWLFAIARFLFGAGFSAGLGLTVVFVAEVFPRYLRTRAATLACAIGVTGPLAAAGCYWALLCFPATSDWPGTATLAIGLALAIASWWRIGRHMLQAPFNKEFFVFERKPRTAEALRNVRNTVFVGKSSTIFWSAAFMGISISLFSDLLHLLPRMDAYRGVINPDFIFCWRYVGIASGTLWAGWQSWRQHSRQRVISQMLALQVLALLLLLFLPIIIKNVGPAPINELGKWACGATLILSGWANSNWIVMLLHTFEQFGKGQRAVAVLLAINVYRFGSIGLIGLNLLHPDWFNHFEFALLGLGLVYIGVGLVASRQLADNFEGDALESDYDPAARPLSGGEIRQKLLEIPEKAWNSEAEGQFLQQVSSILYERMSDTLRENYYLSTLYFAQESDARLGSAGNYHTREETFGLRGLDKNGATDFHTIGEKLIEQGVFSSLSLWLEKNDALTGCCSGTAARASTSTARACAMLRKTGKVGILKPWISAKYNFPTIGASTTSASFWAASNALGRSGATRSKHLKKWLSSTNLKWLSSMLGCGATCFSSVWKPKHATSLACFSFTTSSRTPPNTPTCAASFSSKWPTNSARATSRGCAPSSPGCCSSARRPCSSARTI